MFFIAEAGSNHEGRLDLAKELVDAAKGAGADAVKFQAIVRSKVFLNPEDRPEWVEQGREFFTIVAKYAQDAGIEFMCTPFDPPQITWLNPLVKRWKVASAHIHNWPLRHTIEATDKPIIASMGFLSPWDARREKGVIPLACKTKYPALASDYALSLWAGEFAHREWGISDHTVGIATAVAAVALGASIVEKHMRIRTNSHPDSGPHSLNPGEMSYLIQACREAERARDGKWESPVQSPTLRTWV